ncbi:ferritin-like domain-containing protein [Sulfitobacter sp. KE29]|uniref:ferritin-like domain-containing protein n=1 Tax=unclassified Sulfitobacter TaxID=196795 RepID=UPI0023E29561|nr:MULTISPECIES: ferritin-like domain-containing protein [unclassified Sulfitobacter]MDF3420258.1 ferritin-like domain-containing protein [Sulfitobacter sp. Ks38]MDF3427743.1 ferritin-like domain-containing protein [Sulfitobacter sp. KE29]MDF3431322.1 ferritin-like domain-containing protein [Sulfitobacter sp. S46]MDF3446096.1 ferritin-like domain-containing protein [Sulfitobacter sp. KE31]MDF3550104.1 ferritin-like domain-containing protein [Sulfitobacter sp. KE28]
MPTTVGTETTAADLIKNLLILEYDAIAAYDSTIERLENAEYRQQIETFRQDHEAHVQELGRIADTMGIDKPMDGDMKQWLTTGKVALADLAGDNAILKAMKTNEDDTVAAYQQALDNDITDAKLRPLMEKGLADERRHRAWMETAQG